VRRQALLLQHRARWIEEIHAYPLGLTSLFDGRIVIRDRRPPIYIQRTKGWTVGLKVAKIVISATGRKKLIFAGISLEVCAAFPAITAVGKGLGDYNTTMSRFLFIHAGFLYGICGFLIPDSATRNKHLVGAAAIWRFRMFPPVGGLLSLRARLILMVVVKSPHHRCSAYRGCPPVGGALPRRQELSLPGKDDTSNNWDESRGGGVGI
jgi:hypothetical protein